MILSALGMGTSILGSAIGGLMGSASVNSAKDRLTQGHRQRQNWYTWQHGADYTNRTDFQNILTKQRDLLNEQYKRVRGVNAVSGGSDEQVALEKASANQAIADATSSIASNASSYKDDVIAKAMAENQSYDNAMSQMDLEKAKQIASATEGVMKAGGSMISSDDGSWDWLVKKKSK